MKRFGDIQKTALSITRWIGSPASVLAHSIVFAASFALAIFQFVAFEQMLLLLTTIVSLEAIYLSIFIQMTINYTTETIQEVHEDIEGIQEDVEEISEDVDEIQKDVDEIQKDVDELQEDVGEISEEVEDMSEEDTAENAREAEHARVLAAIQADLRRLLDDIDKLKTEKK